ncbi:DUF1272 domain-containing protein [Dongia sp. agr-C8]
MLELRPNCECGDRDLPPESTEARICTYECTFCAACAETVFAGVCPNCGGNLVPRPIRPAAKLLKDPASQKRQLRSGPCGARTAA